MKGSEYRDRIAAYVHRNFADHDILVYTEVNVGKSIIGKRRKIDMLLRQSSGTTALGLECKY